jgi:hypothetical protein
VSLSGVQRPCTSTLTVADGLAVSDRMRKPHSCRWQHCHQQAKKRFNPSSLVLQVNSYHLVDIQRPYMVRPLPNVS